MTAVTSRSIVDFEIFVFVKALREYFIQLYDGLRDRAAAKRTKENAGSNRSLSGQATGINGIGSTSSSGPPVDL